MDEQVLCIEAWYAPNYRPNDIISTAEHKLLPRSVAETDETHRQLIPYCAVCKDGKFLVYDRKGTEERLHGFSSLGVGGHVNAGEGVWDGARRELMEEAGITSFVSRHYLGAVCMDDTPVNRVHLGLCFIVHVGNAQPKEELLNPRWLSLYECEGLNLEPWSVALLSLLKDYGRSHACSTN